ncbi:MAG: divergent polysaccharide deacetylase family protein [Candidatus Firestonebacteria bacterium]|nr:divergent polysaccharide deacetylase family protein [Candidatus Firestonebacteria bacterium]
MSSKKKLTKRIAIIIDDFGNFYNNKVRRFFDISAPITLAILPQLPFSRSIALDAIEKNFEIMLHFPMEAFPDDYKENKTGPGAILESMSEEKIREILEENLISVPNVKGVNNHMGSKITSNENIMRIFLNMLKEKKLYFIDSLVTSESVSKKIGKKVGIKINTRDIFLDNIDEPQYIKEQINKLVNIALTHGSAIGIGHVEKKHTASVITEMLPYIKSKNIEIVPASEITE